MPVDPTCMKVSLYDAWVSGCFLTLSSVDLAAYNLTLLARDRHSAASVLSAPWPLIEFDEAKLMITS